MPKRDRAEYMRLYRAKRKAERQDRAGPDEYQLAALDSPDADWRRLPPVAALVGLARALPDMEPDDGEGIVAPRPGTLTADDTHWRRLAPQSAFAWLSMMVAATLTPG